MLYIIYVDLQSLIKEIDGCANTPKKSSSVKTDENVHCGYLMPTIWTFDDIEKKTSFISWTTLYKTFLQLLREDATNVINFERENLCNNIFEKVS